MPAAQRTPRREELWKLSPAGPVFLALLQLMRSRLGRAPCARAGATPMGSRPDLESDPDREPEQSWAQTRPGRCLMSERLSYRHRSSRCKAARRCSSWCCPRARVDGRPRPDRDPTGTRTRPGRVSSSRSRALGASSCMSGRQRCPSLRPLRLGCTNDRFACISFHESLVSLHFSHALATTTVYLHAFTGSSVHFGGRRSKLNDM